MNAMTCAQVEAELDLLAAGECDPAMSQAVQRHLQDCPRCASSYRESQRMIGLLDLHWSHPGQQRLRERIERDERRKQRVQVAMPFVRRFAAVAALVLLTLGMSRLLPREQGRPIAPGLELATQVVHDGGPNLKREPVEAVFAPQIKTSAVVRLDLAGKSNDEYRRQLMQAARKGDLPLPPMVRLAFTLRNTGKRNLDIRLGDSTTELRLDIRGKGVIRLPTVSGIKPPVLEPRTLSLRPGETYNFRIDRLIAGSRGQLEYVFLTEPGEYTLIAHLQLTVAHTVTTLHSEAVQIRVER